MLVSFSVENWRSFRDKLTFSMIASAENNFKDRTLKISKRPIVRLLPIAAIFGGNASGKSNIVSAVQAARRFILGRRRLDGQTGFDSPFRLEEDCIKKPTRFSFVILVNITKEKTRVFEYSFGVTQTTVTEEKLIQNNFSGSQELIFQRWIDSSGNVKFEGPLSKNKRNRFVFDGTRRNALFLTSAYSQNVAEIEPVFKWFRESLHIVTPEMNYIDKNILNNQERLEEFSEILDKYDTGISGVTLEDAPPSTAGLAAFMLETEMFSNGPRRMDLFERRGEVIFASEKSSSIECKELKTLRRTKEGTPVKFSFSDESDGTRRLVDIIPICQSLAHEPGSVFIVDELDRRLHPNLVERIVLDYLSGIDESSRSQLIFTTHDANLMDQRPLRRDEIWLVERGRDGVSELFSLAEFKARKDENIRKSYLVGRFGGIPRV